ncbi:MAG TPA: TetR/AcrR family transcriptional regulator [Solirubrobacteraceae bacterium]|nr:TetR/AcrR family transcriptional regulator [Solirubrobacteraceae bacterium]
MATAGPHRPRSRVERREATRAALHAATLASLVELGYAATTTRAVAERAGVSQGALQHHYPTKAALVDAALLELAEQVKQAVIANPPPAPSERERVALLVDYLWELFHQPHSRAIMEVLAAARTDPEIAAGALRVLERFDEIAQSIAAAVVPGLATHPQAPDWLRITIATLRGCILVDNLANKTTAVPPWPVLRAHILRSLDALIDA